MARIALAIGGAILGAVAAIFTGGLINPYTGAEIGFTLGGVVGGLLFPGKLPPGPRLNDLIVSTATDGAPIPFGYGQVRIAGNVIWALPIKEVATTKSVKGGPKQTNYSYYISMAVAFGEGPGVFGRIWFDSKVVYDPSGTSASISAITEEGNAIIVQSTLNPPTGTQVTLAGVGHGYDGNYQCTNSGPVSFVLFSTNTGLPTLGAGGTASFPEPSYPAPTLYLGTETQGADPTIQAGLGASITPAFRGLINAVWNNMPINDFGNRVPNVRAEITYQYQPAGGGTPGIVDFETSASNNDGGTARTLIASSQITPTDTLHSTLALFIARLNTNGGGVHGSLTALSPTVFTPFNSGDRKAIWAIYPPGNGSIQIGMTDSVAEGYAGVTVLLGYQGNTLPSVVQSVGTSGGFGSTSLTLPNPVTPGNVLMLLASSKESIGVTVADHAGFDQWAQAGHAFSNTTGGFGASSGNLSVWFAFNAHGGTTQIDITTSAGGTSGDMSFFELPAGMFSIVIPNTTQIVTDICNRAGLSSSQIDVSLIESLPTPLGYVVTRPSTAQSALAPICSAYFFDGVETNGTIKFVPRGLAASATAIPEADLGLYKDNMKLSEELGQIQDLPADIQVLYNDKALDYQQNHTRKIRHYRVVKTKNESVIELPLTIDSTTARQIAEKALFLAYLERHPYSVNLWRSLYLLYDPTDVVNFTYENLNFSMRITKQTIGADFTMQVSGVNENASTYQSTVNGSSGVGVTPAHGKTIPNSVLFLFDLPLLRDTDANTTGSGYYWGLSSLSPSTWPGGILAQSNDTSTWIQAGASSNAVSYGYTTTLLLPPRSPWSWDTINTVNVFMINGTLAGTSLLNVLNGSNALIIGNEVVQFANAVQNPDGSYMLSMLLRGRRGTEWACAQHTSSDQVVFLNNPGVFHNDVSSADLQVQRYYEGVTNGQFAGTLSNTLFTNTGNDLRPYAVTSVAGSRDGSQNIVVSWIRRTRIGGDWLEGIGTVPLSELTESYDVDIIKNSQVVRTFAGLSSPLLVYTVAQQIADFGSPQTTVSLNIYQNSSVIGRGFVKATSV